MYDLMIYSLKVGACLAVFYLFFKLLLSRETFHRLNRIVLLAATVLSFILPLCVITVCREMPVLPQVVEGVEIPAVLVAEPTPFPWERIAGAAFLLGAAVTLGATLFSLAGVIRLIRRGRREPLGDGMVLVHTDRPVTPFSWGRYIVLSEQDAMESGAEIITHERAHLRLHHSWDLLVTDIAGCLQWFNPAMWLLRRELRAIHEYEADEAVLDSGVDAKHYQLLLIKKAAGGRWYSVANSFNHSKLKNRITMMLQKRSSRWAGARALLVLPLAGLALGAFAETAYVYPEDKGTEKNVTIPAPESGFTVAGYRAEAPRDTLSFRLGGVQGVTEKQPVWILDGMEISQEDSKTLNVNEIASISVQKDASEKKMFPDRDIDGVILVTTKKAGNSAENAFFDAERNKSKPARDSAREQEDAFFAVPEGSRDVRVAVKMQKAMVVIDGVKSDQQGLDGLDPDKIASITVIKDKTAVAIYGPDAANGVIIVTTKKAEAEAKARAAEGGRTQADSEIKVVGVRTIGKKVSTEAPKTIRMSGLKSASNALVIIDGVKSDQKALEALDPYLIESVSVIKDKTAVAIYGPDAANGVIIIETKEAKKAKDAKSAEEQENGKAVKP